MKFSARFKSKRNRKHDAYADPALVFSSDSISATAASSDVAKQNANLPTKRSLFLNGVQTQADIKEKGVFELPELPNNSTTSISSDERRTNKHNTHKRRNSVKISVTQGDEHNTSTRASASTSTRTGNLGPQGNFTNGVPNVQNRLYHRPNATDGPNPNIQNQLYPLPNNSTSSDERRNDKHRSRRQKRANTIVRAEDVDIAGSNLTNDASLNMKKKFYKFTSDSITTVSSYDTGIEAQLVNRQKFIDQRDDETRDDVNSNRNRNSNKNSSSSNNANVVKNERKSNSVINEMKNTMANNFPRTGMTADLDALFDNDSDNDTPNSRHSSFHIDTDSASSSRKGGGKDKGEGKLSISTNHSTVTDTDGIEYTETSTDRDSDISTGSESDADYSTTDEISTGTDATSIGNEYENENEDSKLHSWLDSNRYTDEAELVGTLENEFVGAASDTVLAFSQIYYAFAIDEQSLVSVAEEINDAMGDLYLSKTKNMATTYTSKRTKRR